MLLKNTNPALADREKMFLDWFVENFGREDTATVVDWVWWRERDPGAYLRGLEAIYGVIKSEEAKGLAAGLDPSRNKLGRDAFHRLLEQAREPRDRGEAALQLKAAMEPYILKAKAEAKKFNNSPECAEANLRELRVRLREELRRMYPDKHRATIDGAIAVGSLITGGGATLDFSRIIKALMDNPDALAETAASSHGVSYDR